MTWLGITDHMGGRFSRKGLASKEPLALGKMLERGTLMFETFIAGDLRPHDLLALTHHYPWAREIAFRALPGGGLAFVHKHHDDLTHAAVSWTGDGRANTLRISYSWDARKNWGRLALEQPEHTLVRMSPVPNSRPILLDDLRELILGSAARAMSKEVLFASVSTEIMPVGPMPTLHPATPIATPKGYKAAGSIKRGDTVITEAGIVVPVLHTVRQTVPARASFAPVRLHAPYFGLKRDIVVAPEQRLVLRGTEVEYNFGEEAVLVPARHLVNGHAATWLAPKSIAEYVQLILPGHEVLIAAGTALESLYIGRIRRKSELLAASVLSDIPNRKLPEHGKSIHQVLRSFEAITLIEHRAA